MLKSRRCRFFGRAMFLLTTGLLFCYLLGAWCLEHADPFGASARQARFGNVVLVCVRSVPVAAQISVRGDTYLALEIAENSVRCTLRRELTIDPKVPWKMHRFELFGFGCASGTGGTVEHAEITALENTTSVKMPLSFVFLADLLLILFVCRRWRIRRERGPGGLFPVGPPVQR